MSLLDYAKSELDRIPKDEDGVQERIHNNILEIINIFGEQGHSGFSASYAINALERLLRFKPITSLTDENSECKETSKNRYDYAKTELDKISKDDDGLQELINNDILEIVKTFEYQDYSGVSDEYVISILERLLQYQPLTPLTGEDDEWCEVGRRGSTTNYQNKRCYSVFMDKRDDGTIARRIDSSTPIISDNGGITWFTCGDFRKEVTFPYYPPTEPEKVYIEYTDDVPPGFTGDSYDIITDDPDRIKALYERKRKEFDEIEVCD